MTLIDTSVWIEHLNKNDQKLENLLEKNEVLTHPFVIGELACGRIKSRKKIFQLLNKLPQVKVASDEEVLIMIENLKLSGLGLGYIDIHLLASSRLSNCKFFTYDKRLNQMSNEYVD